jgi:hypothetical protein
MPLVPVSLILASAVLGGSFSPAQTAKSGAPPLAASAPTVVPALVPYSGVAVGGDGKPLSGEAGATFLIFKDEQGGEPLFVETQTVAVDDAGHYTAQLGATLPNGLPADLFATGEARWLEVQIAGQPAQPRALMASVPYALKAADAATLGGLPASAYALAAPSARSAASAAVSPATAPTATDVTTTGGVIGYIPEFSGASAIVDSPLFVLGNDVGVGTATPTATLDVNGTGLVTGLLTVGGGMTVTGGATYNGPFSLPAQGTATASSDFASQVIKVNTSAYNSSTKAAVSPRFEIQAFVTGQNTANPGATLDVLASTTTAGALPTGFSINTSGIVSFAPGQTFPATSTTGPAVEGTSTSGPAVEGTSSSGYGVEGSSSTSSGVVGSTSASGTGNAAGVYGTAAQASGILTSGAIAGVWGDSYNDLGVLGTSNFIGVYGASGTGDGVAGSSTSGEGVYGYTTGTADAAGLLGVVGEASGLAYGTVAGVWGDSYSYTGVTGASVSSPGVQGVSYASSGVAGTSEAPAEGTAGVRGVTGAGSATYSAEKGSQVAGVWGDTSGNPSSGYAAGVIGTAGNADGGTFFNNSTAFATIYAENLGAGDGVSGRSDQGGIGLNGYSSGGIGVYGQLVGASKESTELSLEGAGAWGDTSATGAAALLATADEGYAAIFANNGSDFTTLQLFNNAESSSHAPIFLTYGGTFGGQCLIDVSGNLTCSGKLTNVVNAGESGRQVQTYSVQSAENWLEDAGTGQLSGGAGHVDLEPVFGQTVNTGVEYHVFLTPDGDCNGLYVSAKSSGGFDVRELGGGKSNVAFEYRIMAKRSGYEDLRLADVTEQVERQREQSEKLRHPANGQSRTRPQGTQQMRPSQPGAAAPQLRTPALPPRPSRPTLKTPQPKVAELR